MGYIVTILVLVVLSAFFSATETAFTSANRIRLKNLAGDGNKGAKKALELIDNYDTLLSSILVGNNIVNIAMSAVGTVFFLKLYPVYGAMASTIVITVVVLIFGEVSPKSLAKEKAESLVMISAPVMEILVITLSPINWLFTQWKGLLSKVFRVEEGKPITEDELKTIVEEAQTEGGIDEGQSELIQNAIEFNELEAWDVLTPRVDMVAIEIDEERTAIAELFRKTGFSRIPVYEDDMDNILGVLNQKDFHNYISGTDTPISKYVKPVVFVARTMKISQLLKRLQTSKSHIAIVVDEYGGTFGLVTLEDIIEELVGEIYDEHDAVQRQEIIKLADGQYRVLCSANVDKIFDYFDVKDEVNAATVNGWVVLQLDKLPAVGDFFLYENGNKRFDVVVTKADSRKALEINMAVTILPEEE